MASFSSANGPNFWQGGLLAACGGRGVVAWDATGSNRQHVQLKTDETVNSLQWSGNNKVLAYAGQKGAVALYNQEKYMGGIPNATTRVKVLAEINCLRFSRDSKKLYVGCKDGGIFVWDLKLQDLVHTISDHKSPITSLCVANADTHIASASNEGSLLLHTCSSSPTVTVISAGGGVGVSNKGAAKRSLAFSPQDSRLLAAACDDLSTVCLWDVSAVGGGGSVPMQRLPAVHSQPVSAVCFSAPASPSAGSVLYTCSADGNLVAWDRRTDKAVQYITLPAPLGCLATRDDGCYVATGAQDGSIFVIDLRKMSSPSAKLRESSASIAELHWQSVHRTSRRSSTGAAGALPPATASAAPAPAQTARPAVAATAAASVPASKPGPSDRTLSTTAPSASLSSWLAQPQPQAQANNPSQASLAPALPNAREGAEAEAMDMDTDMDPSPSGGVNESGDVVSQAAPSKPSSLSDASGSAAGSKLPPPPLSVPAAGSTATLTRAELPTPSPKGPDTPYAAGHHLGTSSGTTAAGIMRPSTRQLSETVFRQYMDDAFGSVNEGLRNLQIEMIRQFHMQQVEMMSAIQGIVSRQEELCTEMRSLKVQVEQVMRRQRDPVDGNSGWR